MRKPDALAGLVLRPRAAKQVKYPLMILGIDPAAIVGDGNNNSPERVSSMRPGAR